MANSTMGLRPASRLNEYAITMRMIEEHQRRDEETRNREMQEYQRLASQSMMEPIRYWSQPWAWDTASNQAANQMSAISAIASLAMGSGTFGAAPVALIDMPQMESIGTVPIEVTEEDLTNDRNRLAMDAESVLGYTKIREKVKAPSQLRCVLSKLEIEVLNAAEVQAYKLQACKHMSSHKKLGDPRWAVTALEGFKGEIPEFVIMKAVEVKKELPNAQFFVEHLQEDPFLIVTTLPRERFSTGWTGNLGQLAVSQPDDVMYLEVWNEKSFEHPNS